GRVWLKPLRACHCRRESHVIPANGAIRMPRLFLEFVGICLLRPQEVSSKSDQTREAKCRIDIVLDDVKGEVVKPAERPYRYPEQHRNAEARMLKDKKSGSTQTNYQKRNPFQFDQSGTFEVSHNIRIRPVEVKRNTVKNRNGFERAKSVRNESVKSI